MHQETQVNIKQQVQSSNLKKASNYPELTQRDLIQVQVYHWTTKEMNIYNSSSVLLHQNQVKILDFRR